METSPTKINSLFPGVANPLASVGEASAPDGTGFSRPSVSQEIAQFGAAFSCEDIPPHVKERAKDLILDSIGIALSSSREEFAHSGLRAMAALAGGTAGSSTVIGMSDKLPLRDAVHLNGILVHGMDYDDTHAEAIVHPSCTVLPVVLTLGESRDTSGRDALASYVLGVEVTCRIGLAAAGQLHRQGHHSTATCGTFGAAVAASALLALSPHETAMAQGLAGSMAAGSLEFLEEGAWVKRSHAGWAGVCGITAASMAQAGFSGPRKVYEGRYGLFATHTHPSSGNVDPSRCAKELGSRWETLAVGIKPFPTCLFTHAYADAALAIRKTPGLEIDQISCITALSSDLGVQMVFEPLAEKRTPSSAYAAQFSVPYIVSAALQRGRFGYEELEPAALNDAAILELAGKVGYAPDPASGFPKVFSGELVVELKNGKVLRHREQVNRGYGDRPLTRAEIIHKYRQNAALAVSEEHAERILDRVLHLDELASIRELTTTLSTDTARLGLN